MNAKVREMDKLSLMFKTHYDETVERVEKLLEENKELGKKIEKLEEENARAKFSTFASKAEEIDGGKLFISKSKISHRLRQKSALNFFQTNLAKA